MLLTISLILFVFAIPVKSDNNNTLQDIDNYFNLFTDIQRFYTADSIYIIYGDVQENFAFNSILLNILKQLSARKIMSQALRQSYLFEKYNDIFWKNARQLMVVVIENEISLRNFETFAKLHVLTYHVWLVIFWSEPSTSLLKFCENPKGNPFYLSFNIRMLVKCYDNPVIKEWYALNSKYDMKVSELLEWHPGKNLLQIDTRNFYKRRHDFNGTLLKVSIIKELNDLHKITENEDERKVDMIYKFMTEVTEYMNFTVLHKRPNKNYGLFNKTTRKWNGMLGNLSNGDIDMSFTEITMTQQRFQDFDFTWPLFTTPNILYIKRPDTSMVKWNAYSNAFDYKIWISIIILMIIASVIITLIKTATINRYYSKNYLLENFLYVWGVYCQQGLPDFPNSSALRIAYVSLFFSSIIITAAYSGSIVSNLTTLSTFLPFTSFAEFVKLATYKLIVMHNSFDDEYFSYATDPILIKMKELMKPQDELPSNNIQGFRQICKEKAAFYTNEIMQQKVSVAIPCKLAAVHTGGHRFMALPLVKNNPLTKFINYHIRRFDDYGLTKRVKNKYSRRTNQLRKHYEPVGVWEITPLLTILTFGVIVSIVVLLFECIIRNIKHNLSNSVNKEIVIYESHAEMYGGKRRKFLRLIK